MSGKLDFEKDRRNRMPREIDTDGLPSVNSLGNRPHYAPKTPASEAKRQLQINIQKLSEKLSHIASLDFNTIISTSRKKLLVNGIEDSIHLLRASTYVSGRLSDDHPLILQAKRVVLQLRKSLPKAPPVPFGVSPLAPVNSSKRSRRPRRK